MAAMAKDLDSAAEAPQVIAGWLAGRIALWLGHPPLVQRIAKELTEQVVEKIVEATTWPIKFKLTSRFLRICGIWTCVDAGLDLRGCQCFKDLAEGHTQDFIKRILEEKLDKIA